MPLSISKTNQLLKSLGHEPRKQLGQNFLIDGNIVHKSLKMAQLRSGERVVEVGPGLGTLTEIMLEKGAQVYAVEFDRRLYEHLSTSLLPRYPQTLHLLYADALDHPLAGLPIEALQPTVETEPQTAKSEEQTAKSAPLAQNTQPITNTPAAPALTQTAAFKIIANLPYAISTPWLEAVLGSPLRPRVLVLMLQKEAAERFVAEPGSKTYGAISIFIASAYRMGASHPVPRQCFYPVPGVDSVLLLLEVLPQVQPWPPLARHFVRQFFIHRRKQIGSLVRRTIEELKQPAQPEKLSAKRRRVTIQTGAQASADVTATPTTTADTPTAAIATPDAPMTTSTAPSATSANAATNAHLSPLPACPEAAHQAATHLENWLVALQQLGISAQTRPEAISLEGWQQLARIFSQRD